MADGGRSSGFRNLAKDFSEAVINPVKDEIGKAVESGVQSVAPFPKPKTQNPQDPKSQQQAAMEQKKEEMKKIRNVKLFLNRYTGQEQRERQLREQRKQMYQQQDQQQKQKDQRIKDFNIGERKKEENLAVKNLKLARETRKGIGG